MDQITTVGVDLAKDVIVICASDDVGRVALFRQFSFHGFGQWAATKLADRRITGRVGSPRTGIQCVS